MNKIGEEAKYQYPSNVYDNLVLNSSTTGPRDVKQIRNKKYADKRKGRTNEGNVVNFADNIQALKDGIREIGYFNKDGKLHGKGKRILADGTVQEGDWK